MAEIVQEFAIALVDRRRSLQTFLAENDLDPQITLYFLDGSALKGAGGGYGFQAITDAAARLEQALKEGAEPSTIKDHCQTLCEVLDAVKAPEAP